MTEPIRSDDALPRTSLGQRRDVPCTYSPGLLEAIPLAVERSFPGQTMWVDLTAERFTSLCPVTGQPDWAEIAIAFIPGDKLVESKSLKEYLHSYRMHGAFHEDICRMICDDLVRCIAPRYLEVLGRFDSRGSISIHPFVQYALPGDAEAKTIRAERRRGRSPGSTG